MHHGSTVVHWDSSGSHSTICYLKMESDNATLSWCKPQWSALGKVITTIHGKWGNSPKKGISKKINFFFCQRHALSTSFGIFVVAYGVTNFLPKQVDMLLFFTISIF